VKAGQEMVDFDASTVVLKWDAIYTAVDLSLGITESKSEFNLKVWLHCVVGCLRIIIEEASTNAKMLPIFWH